MNFDHDLRFWVAVIGATLLKLLTSQANSPVKVIVTVIAAVFAAWVFTDPLIHWMQWDAATYKAPLAALLALTGEGIMRSLMTINLEKLLDYWRKLRP